MDLAPLFEALGEREAVAVAGLLIGMAFGACAQRSRFCLRSAVIEFARGERGTQLPVWLLAFSTAVLATQALIATDRLDVSEARQLAGAGSISGAILGGLMFGTGMILARGCASRLLVLSATGNLRALLSGLVFAVAAQAALHGVLSPVRDMGAGLVVAHDPETVNLLMLLSLDRAFALAFAALWLVAGIYFGVRARVGAWGWGGGVGAGAMVAAGWYVTYEASTQSFEPVQVESLTFTGPSADTLMFFLLGRGDDLDFDVGLVPGVFLGSFLAAALFRELRIEGFRDGPSMRRYLLGAALMGFGGMLAGGCAVGAGVTGGAIYALPAWLALCAMWLSAGLTDALVDRPASRPGRAGAAAGPA